MTTKKKSPARRQELNHHPKDKHIVAQEKTIHAFFLTHHTTMFDAAVRTGIERPNICRYISHLEEDNLVIRTHKGTCPISGEAGVWYFKATEQKGGFCGTLF